MAHAHMYGCWVIRTMCLITEGTIQLVQLIVANDHSCKCRYLNWSMFSNSNLAAAITHDTLPIAATLAALTEDACRFKQVVFWSLPRKRNERNEQR
jgi:hypothetical protein